MTQNFSAKLRNTNDINQENSNLITSIKIFHVHKHFPSKHIPATDIKTIKYKSKPPGRQPLPDGYTTEW